MSTLWHKLDGKSGRHINSKYVWISRNGEYQFIMLEPGTYSLKRFDLENGSHVRRWVETKKDLFNPETNKPTFASFTVNSGEIVYLGDIEISSYNIARNSFLYEQSVITKVKADNNVEMAKSSFYSRYPKLKNYNITTRIIQTNAKDK